MTTANTIFSLAQMLDSNAIAHGLSGVRDMGALSLLSIIGTRDASPTPVLGQASASVEDMIAGMEALD